MKSAPRRLLRAGLAGLALLVFVGLLAPFIKADRWSESIHSALEFSLGRSVTWDSAHFTVFSGPGVALENVNIGEDPKFGIEPFAHVPTLEARLRLDKLLLGQIRFSSLRLVEPSLNLVRRSDGAWNIVELVSWITAPRRAPLSLFPALEVSEGRVDFKFGDRKSTLYISGADLTMYPQRRGKLLIQFSGSPARTDRAGTGFGHFRGSVNWMLHPRASEDQLAAEITLDPSNLSELTTLVEGQDAGVHGTVSAVLHLNGPPAALRLHGELRLNDVHRWDLMPASGEEWRVRYAGSVDLLAHNLDVVTVPARSGQETPIVMHIRANNFLARPACSVVAELRRAPLADLRPLAIRMGVRLPEGAVLHGALEGAIGYSNTGGWAGGVTVSDAEATLPNAPSLKTARALVGVSNDRIHFHPADVSVGDATVRLGGDYFFSQQQAAVSLAVEDAPVAQLKSVMGTWFENPEALAAFADGQVTGNFAYASGEAGADVSTPAWSGQFEFAGSRLTIPGLAAPVEHARGRAVFDSGSFELDRVTASLDGLALRASYRYNLAAKHPEHVRVELAAADWNDLEAQLQPGLQPQSLWARLRFLRRPIPAWLRNRNLDGDFVVHRLSVGGHPLGALAGHFTWQGATIDVGPATLQTSEGTISGTGAVSLAAYLPRVTLNAAVSALRWKSGLLNVVGQLQTAGLGTEILRNLSATGSFSGQNIALSDDDFFNAVAGQFRFDLSPGWPNLHVSDIRAEREEEEWSGEATSDSDGKLLVDLGREGKQMRIVSSLVDLQPAQTAPLSLLPRVPQAVTR